MHSFYFVSHSICILPRQSYHVIAYSSLRVEWLPSFRPLPLVRVLWIVWFSDAVQTESSVESFDVERKQCIAFIADVEWVSTVCFASVVSTRLTEHSAVLLPSRVCTTNCPRNVYGENCGVVRYVSSFGQIRKSFYLE